MAIEIERKFLVKDLACIKDQKGIYIRQGYIIADSNKAIVRVRVTPKESFLTVKSKKKGISRFEYEYQIPQNDAAEMLENLCLQTVIEKIRYNIEYCGLTWEIDVFEKENKGLVVAEVELESESQKFDNPDWLGREVTLEKKYLNINLAKNPYSTWK